VALEVFNVLQESFKEFSTVNTSQNIYGIQEEKNDLAFDFLKKI
jgi:hypothetical protein